MPARSRTRRGAGVVAIRSSTASSSGTSRPPMCPDPPVTRQCNGDGPGRRGVEEGRYGHLAVPRRSQRLALREECPDTAVTAESARRSNLALRADGSWRAAATATRWTSSRASGNAMASSSQVRSRPDRKTHMLSVPSSSSRLETNPEPPGGQLAGPVTALSCASAALSAARFAHSRACLIVFAALPATRLANHAMATAALSTSSSTHRSWPRFRAAQAVFFLGGGVTGGGER